MTGPLAGLTIVDLSGLSGSAYIGYISHVTSDGSTVVGQGGGTWRWTIGNDPVLITPHQSGGSYVNAYGINPDASVVVGTGNSSGGLEAFRWTAEGGTESLGFLPGGPGYSIANAVSADGNVIVGRSISANGTEGYIWTEAEGMVVTENFFANDISLDGCLLIGSGILADNISEAAVWSEETGMISVFDFLTGQGIDLTDWTLSSLAAISDDGTALIGPG